MKKNNLFRDAFILTMITLIAGLLLASVYSLTKDPIAKKEEQTLTASYQQVFKAADTFKSTAQSKQLKRQSKQLLAKADIDFGKRGVVINNILQAYHNHKVQGWVFDLTTKDGYGGDIEVVVGVKNQQIIGTAVLKIKESAGLGQNASKESWRKQYLNKAVKVFKVVKNENKPADDEIDAISGATITSKAFTNAMNAALYLANQSSEVITHE